MTTLTIPQSVIKEQKLIVIPKKIYEELIRARDQKIKEIELNATQKKALLGARKNLNRNKFLTIHGLKQKLGIAN